MRHEDDGADGHFHNNVVGGFEYYKTIFKTGNEYFEGIINIANTTKGEKLHDITKIQNITQDIMSSYGKNPKSQFLRNVSMVRIPQESERNNGTDGIYSDIEQSIAASVVKDDNGNDLAEELRSGTVVRGQDYLREKRSKKLGVSLPLDKAGAKKLKAQRQELTEENKSLRPRLGQIREELDQLSKLRYWTRKAIPEALPERDDFSEQMEARENRCELEQVMDAAIEAVTQETDEQQPVQADSKQKHDQERQ